MQPRVISITQSTEMGTVYKTAEIEALTRFAHERKMFLHMDGARISNAVAAQGLTLRQATRDLGVDVLSFGGTKNGPMGVEAVVFFRPELAQDFLFVRKQGMQLASKMRFMAAQMEALLTNDLWKRNAEHANRMARLLEQEIKRFREQGLCIRWKRMGCLRKYHGGRLRRFRSATSSMWERRRGGGAVDVFVRYYGRRRAPVCRICRRSCGASS